MSTTKQDGVPTVGLDRLALLLVVVFQEGPAVKLTGLRRRRSLQRITGPCLAPTCGALVLWERERDEREINLQ